MSESNQEFEGSESATKEEPRERLERITGSVKRFRDERIRAQEAASIAAPGSWHVALVGLTPSGAALPWTSEIATLKDVSSPPSLVSLSGAIAATHYLGFVAQWASITRYELVLNDEFQDEKYIDGIGWTFICGIRMISECEFIAPIAADRSWDTVAGITDSSVIVKLLEDDRKARTTGRGERATLSPTQFKWVDDNFLSILTLREDRRFQLALESLSLSFTLDSPRVCIFVVWSGIEALFGIKDELRFRLALYVSVLTRKAGPDRERRFGEVRKLYDTRSRVVHGAPTDKDDLITHLLEVRQVLRDCLCSIVSRGTMAEPQILEAEFLN